MEVSRSALSLTRSASMSRSPGANGRPWSGSPAANFSERRWDQLTRSTHDSAHSAPRLLPSSAQTWRGQRSKRFGTNLEPVRLSRATVARTTSCAAWMPRSSRQQTSAPRASTPCSSMVMQQPAASRLWPSCGRRFDDSSRPRPLPSVWHSWGRSSGRLLLRRCERRWKARSTRTCARPPGRRSRAASAALRRQ